MSEQHAPSARTQALIGRVFAAILFVFAVIYGIGGTQIEYSFSSDPLGPTVFPIALAIALCLFCAWYFFSPGSAEGFPTGRLLLRVLSIPVIMIVAVLLLEPAGFAASIFVLTLGCGIVFGASPIKAAIGAVCHAALWWFIFSYLLEVYLPVGDMFG
ncbi:tripartite tricarboxylate transporter TctB family protein [Rhizobium halophytocola]|uniref:Tricarboxylic transport membrane protein n=1 Tax=Rhizobium halophytocola TaxID=735519 RepID=A0ABS4E398_9HYPH|nr:tripartite tricarboxylate transporter TctB family protein [Rhizobium halophytocola]MBP1852408.1 putative tricarboxylic transport membrane protein [Rhizobium halophytocola]